MGEQPGRVDVLERTRVPLTADADEVVALLDDPPPVVLGEVAELLLVGQRVEVPREVALSSSSGL